MRHRTRTVCTRRTIIITASAGVCVRVCAADACLASLRQDPGSACTYGLMSMFIRLKCLSASSALVVSINLGGINLFAFTPRALRTQTRVLRPCERGRREETEMQRARAREERKRWSGGRNGERRAGSPRTRTTRISATSILST